MPPTVAALYVQYGGVYYGLPDVEPWGLPHSDARDYTGPHPVVAHPPCHLWTNLAAVNFKRYGEEHNRPGNDGGCFAAAVEAVKRWGGVLEHPAFSRAWTAYRLVPPRKRGGWIRAGERAWTCEVWQNAYGHRARKRTWLYYVGPEPPALNWSRNPGDAQIGWFDRNKPTLSKKEASATPIPFRDLLLSLARGAY
jgi:hypothetical protein